MEYFTRYETVVLTRLSPGSLAYLAKTGIVVPLRPEGELRPLYYSWEQILELRAIQHLRRQVSLQTIRKILAFLERIGGDRTLHNKHLVISDGDVDWVQTGWDKAPHVVRVATRANRHVGQLKLMVIPPITDLVDDVWEAARQSKVIDFESFRQRALQSRLD